MRNRFQALSALAGSGKTHQLTTRFIGLLSLGAPPDSILAITFTRKAAGEIFDRIVNRLADALLDDQRRLALEADLRVFHGDNRYRLESDILAQWLTKLLEAMPRLHLGTIDSLFMGIVKAYAPELGLPPHQEILEGGRLQDARELALREALRKARRDADATRAFLEAFKQATFDEAKRVREVILSKAEQCHHLALHYPLPESWGERRHMWSEPAWWERDANADIREFIERKDAFLERHVLPRDNKAYLGAWEKFFNQASTNNPAHALDSTLSRNLIGQLDNLARGSAEISYSKKNYTLSGPDARDALFFLGYLAAGEFERGLNVMRGNFRLMEVYETAYDHHVRLQGRLSFADIQVLLSRAAKSELKMDMDYRLDGRFDHWLLDEFQDTSALQWSVLGNLADEVLQSTEGDRSFFYVGDIKQAIYGWRGGDSSLFEAVQTYYRELFGERPTVMNTSWRSSPVVLEAVNQVFGEALAEPLASFEPVLARWQKNWTEHIAAPKNARLPGRVELHILERENAFDDDPIHEVACRLAKKLLAGKVPSIAVLVRTNDTGDTITDRLRGMGVEVRREQNPLLVDNNTVAALLSLLQWTDHPGDEFALRHIETSGLFAALASQLDPGVSAEPSERRAAVAGDLRRKSSQNGIAGLLRETVSLCRRHGLPMDTFTDVRIRQLLDAAQEYDQHTSGSPSAFAALAESMEVKDPLTAGGVAVMTIHKAKGLEFDAVILPDLQGTRGLNHVNTHRLTPFHPADPSTRPIANPADPVDEGGWVFPLPGKDIAQLDPVMTCFRRQAEHRQAYENLCLLYVAMTRARQGLYLITPEPAKTGTTVYPSTVLQQTLGRGTRQSYKTEELAGMYYAFGDKDWFAGKTAAPAPSPASIQPKKFKPDAETVKTAERRLIVTTPSSEETAAPLKASILLAAGGTGARRGGILHELFQRIEWHEPGVGEKVWDEWSRQTALPDPQTTADVKALFFHALKNEEILAALSRPAGPAELWREQGFELADNGRWITGRMDRITIERNPDGQPVRATILDFKSDQVADENEMNARAKTYQPQMDWYIKALSLLLGLPAKKITARLAFLRPGRVVDLSF